MITANPNSQTKPVSPWAQYYANRLNSKYQMHIRTRYQYMLNRIAREMASFESINEVGCGIGSITKQLLKYPQASGLHFTCSDINPEMLDLTRRNLAGTNVEFFHHDLLAKQLVCLPIYGRHLMHSHGVLEHFSDEQIRKIVDFQKKSADLIFHYVPSDKYQKKSFGDERLMSAMDWYEICKPDLIEEFNNGYDLLLIFRGGNV